MNTTLSRFGFLLALCLAVTFTTHAQQASQKNSVRITVGESAWSDDGSLVLSVRIHAPANRGLNLYTGSSDFGSTDPVQPFSMAGSYLLDGYTGKKIEALPRLPAQPYYGPMKMATPISRGGSVDLAVAFPAPPPPPPSKDGKPQPYKLTLYVPLDVQPVPITVPAKP